jgi:hypothetical protein
VAIVAGPGTVAVAGPKLDSSPDWLTLDFASYGVPANRGQLVEVG